MLQALPNNRTSWVFKACESALRAIAVLNLFLFPLPFLPVSFLEKYGHYVESVLIGSVSIALLGSLIYSSVWHRREQTNTLYSEIRHAWLQAIIRYWLALSIASYGFAKTLKNWFQTPNFFLDRPLSSVNGMGLTWYYFVKKINLNDASFNKLNGC